MLPECVVLVYKDKKLHHYEFYFDYSKGDRAFNNVLQGKSLRSEIGDSSVGLSGGEARIVSIPTILTTNRERLRYSFLNLQPDEVAELSADLEIPPEVIKALAQVERNIYERRRVLEARYDDRTKALMRRYLPSWLLRWII